LLVDLYPYANALSGYGGLLIDTFFCCSQYATPMTTLWVCMFTLIMSVL